MLGIYLLTGPIVDLHVERMAGEPPAAVPGYSVLVGLNQGSDDCWNEEDSQCLSLYSNEPSSTAQGVQQEMLEKAKERAFSGEIDYPALLWAKLECSLAGMICE